LKKLIESRTYVNGESNPQGAASTTIGILRENEERLISRLGARVSKL